MKVYVLHHDWPNDETNEVIDVFSSLGAAKQSVNWDKNKWRGTVDEWYVDSLRENRWFASVPDAGLYYIYEMDIDPDDNSDRKD